MGIIKWAALGVLGLGFAGITALGSLSKYSADSYAMENTRFLVDQYKAAPQRVTAMIKRHSSACLTERVGKSAPQELTAFVGDSLVYMIQNADKDQETFAKGYMAYVAKNERNVDRKIAALRGEDRKRVDEFLRDFSKGPHAMLGCVTKKAQA